MDHSIKTAYEQAKVVFARHGVDTDKALEQFHSIPVSLHCWAGDDIKGFEGLGSVESQNVVTGSYPYAARTGDELRGDIDFAFSLSPLKHKVNLHSMYAERQNPRNDLNVEDFRKWIDWAKAKGYGLDYNTSYFTHPMMNNGFSLASDDPKTRAYWVKAGLDSRKISVAIGKELGQKCYNNIWIPDGFKDLPANRLKYRRLLTESLDQIFATPYTPEEQKYACDVLEGKLFGIGTESFVVGSHDFYLGYAIKNHVGVCMDMGHYHPDESVADKLSAVRPFIKDLMLHVSRGLHWDSDHVVIQDDRLQAVMTELKRGGFYDSVAIGLDFFDASINRVTGWAIGLRATAKAILTSLLEPTGLLEGAEAANNLSRRLFLTEEAKNLPVQAVWEYLLASAQVPIGLDAIEHVETYEKNVQSKRV
ncbi:MAG TPA: L-rhamnose isomerase [Bacillota bacterium]|nr:L-rhamnose isomerase [Bacillota bacterium]